MPGNAGLSFVQTRSGRLPGARASSGKTHERQAQGHQPIGAWLRYHVHSARAADAVGVGAEVDTAFDSTGIGFSGFTFALSAGASYIVVTTGFESGVDFGAYSNSISGPGTVNVVPEPGTYGLMALGLAFVGFAARRSRAR